MTVTTKQNITPTTATHKVDKSQMDAIVRFVYAHTHSDYKGNIDGEPSVLYLDENGATVSGPIRTMPKSCLLKRLSNSKGEIHPDALRFFNPV